MAISTQSAVLAKRHAGNAVRAFAFGSSLAQFISTLFQELSQKKGNPDLQVVEVVQNGTTAVVIANAPCRLYALVLQAKTTADSYQAADHASSAASPTTVLPLAIGGTVFYSDPAGKAFANGITFNGLNAGANVTGFALIGQP